MMPYTYPGDDKIETDRQLERTETMTYPMTEDGPSYDDDGVLNLYPERTATVIADNVTMTEIEDLTEVRNRREKCLLRVQEEILAHHDAIVRLEVQAAKWERGVAAVEQQIEEMTELLIGRVPLDLTPTGEGDDTDKGDGWEDAGYIVGELPID